MHGVLYILTKWWLNTGKVKRVSGIEKERDITTIQNKIEEKTITANKRKIDIKKLPACLGTFAYVSIAWVYFRAATVEQANILLSNVITKPWNGVSESFLDVFNLGEFWYVLKILKIAALPYAKGYLMVLFTVVTLAITFAGKNVDELAKKFKPTTVNALITAILFVWCVVSLSGVSTFLYFNF